MALLPLQNVALFVDSKQQQQLSVSELNLKQSFRRDYGLSLVDLPASAAHIDDGILQKGERWRDLLSDARRYPDFGHKKAAKDSASPGRVASLLAGWDAGVRESRECDGNWVEILTECCEEGELKDSVEALEHLVKRGCHVTHMLFYRVLKRCVGQKDLGLGSRVHALACRCGYESNPFLATHMIGIYASHGRLREAVEVFDKVAAPDAHLWATIILAHARHGQVLEAMKLYRLMRDSIVKPDDHVYVAILKACAAAEHLVFGKEVHADILANPGGGNIFVGNSLVNMYAKCGSLDDARKVFDSLPERDVVTWTAMIKGYTQQGLCRQALAVYQDMQQEGVIPADHVTFVCLLQACIGLGALVQGKELHARIQERGLEGNVFIGSCLVDMYAKCGSLEDARRLFDRLPTRSVVVWNAMIAGYAQHGLGGQALDLYAGMQRDGMTLANAVTFMSLLQACASFGDMHHGKQLHAQIRQRGLEADVLVGNCLVDMYSKCGSLDNARSVFDRMPTRDVVTWTSMMAGYVQQGKGIEALSLYSSMQQEGIVPANQVTFVCLLRACTSVGALLRGKELHACIRKQGLDTDTLIGSCLVDMYAKCGRLNDAQSVFDGLPNRDVVTWSALLNGYAEHGDGRMAIKCFKGMLEDGVHPDATTFICLLVACSHAGLVREGRQYFGMMKNLGIQPTAHHYNCMIDLLGRSGLLDEAEHILRTMPAFEKNVVGLTCLLSACRSHGDAERGRRCFDRLVELEPENATAYVLLGNIYASNGRWDNVDRIENLRRDNGAKKKPAKVCIEVNNRIHEFTVGEERLDISSKIRSVDRKLKDEGGHMPQTELVLKPGSELQKEDALCGHAEKLALAYGLLNTPQGTPLMVTKNLRMCNDCHSSTKIMSRLENRDIIVRDAHRVHRFVEGSCSCGDRH